MKRLWLLTTMLAVVLGGLGRGPLKARAVATASGPRGQLHAIPRRGLQVAQGPTNPITDALVQSYYASSGFPKAGRTLPQKVAEAERFLGDHAPLDKSGAVGFSAVVVYEDQVVLSKGYGLRAVNETSAPVTQRSLFQIGSFTKTFIALGVGLLVDDGKVQWRDSVKKHLPWLELYDKYMEEHLTIGDLLAMNSGFGRREDLQSGFVTERELIKALKSVPPGQSLREVHDYANINFNILGQMIENVSGQSWDVFLRERLWKPLGMNKTFATVFDVPQDGSHELTAGHLACGGSVQGPFDLVKSQLTHIPFHRDRGLDAGGSIVSAAEDIATVLRLIQNKGYVGPTKLFNSEETINEMITGKVPVGSELMQFAQVSGLHYNPNGGTLASGYGFDFVGQAIWGHPYFDKGGDVPSQHTRTGFTPTHRLAVALLTNTQNRDPHFATYFDHLRVYLMGIFLDVPQAILQYEFNKMRTINVENPFPPETGIPLCGVQFWENPMVNELPEAVSNQLVGLYQPTIGRGFFPTIDIQRRNGTHEFEIIIGAATINATYVGDVDGEGHIFLGNAYGARSLIPISTAPDGTTSFGVGVDYVKVDG